MADIIIGKAKVIAIEEVIVAEKPLVISRLKVESSGRTEGFSAIEGIMQIPTQLPFGKIFELTLHDPNMDILNTNGRMFNKDGEDG